MNHLGLRTCDWTQRLKPLPTTRTRQSPHKTDMGMPRCITWDFALVIGRNVTSHSRQRARESRHARQLSLFGTLTSMSLRFTALSKSHFSNVRLVPFSHHLLASPYYLLPPSTDLPTYSPCLMCMCPPVGWVQVALTDVRGQASLCFHRLHSIPHASPVITGMKINEI